MTAKVQWFRCEGVEKAPHGPVIFPRWLWEEPGSPLQGGCPVCTAKISIGIELKALLQSAGLVAPDDAEEKPTKAPTEVTIRPPPKPGKATKH